MSDWTKEAFERADQAAEEEAFRQLRAERRERIATAVLAALAKAPPIGEGWHTPGTAAVAAIQWADALIAELDKP